MSLAHIPVLAPSAIALLMNYRWPGNVRELQNAVERELILSKGGPLTFESLAVPAPKSSLPETPGGENTGVLNLNTSVSRHITKALEMMGGKVGGPRGAARILQINPSTLRKKMKKLGIPFGREKRKMEKPLGGESLK